MNAKEIKVDSHKILEENCHIEYDKAGELTVCSSLASVQIAMESYHQAKSKEEAMDFPLDAFIEMLQNDNRKLLDAGHNLAEAAVRVVKDYDGVHRLSLALSDWYCAIGNQGNRDEISAFGKEGE